MIVKMMKRSSFKTVISYIVRPDHKPRMLHAEGVRIDDVNTISRSFERQAEMNPRVKTPVLHCSFSFALQDNVEPDQMVACIKKWQHLMGYDNTQMIIYQHQDHDYSHCHAVFNRIDYNGKTLSDKNDRFRSTKVCKTIIHEFDLYLAPGKGRINANRLRNKDKAKYDLMIKVLEAKKHSTDWRSFDDILRRNGITMRLRLNNERSKVMGISFSDGRYTFAGSKIDRSLSYFRLNTYLLSFQQTKIPCENTSPQDSNIVSQRTSSILPFLVPCCNFSDLASNKEYNKNVDDFSTSAADLQTSETDEGWFEVAPIHVFQPFEVHSMTSGGGGSNSEYCDPKKKKKGEDEDYIEVKPTKKRR